MPDPFSAIAEFVLGRIKDGIWAQWLRFLFELAFSALCSFLLVAGGTMMGTASFEGMIAGCGAGMVMAALSMVYLFRRERSKLTAGMIIALPSSESAKEIATDFEVIQKSELTKTQEKK